MNYIDPRVLFTDGELRLVRSRYFDVVVEIAKGKDAMGVERWEIIEPTAATAPWYGFLHALAEKLEGRGA